MKKTILALIASVVLASSAYAASLNVTVSVNSVASTSILCGVSGAVSFTGPASSGAVICSITVGGAGWSGSLALSGADAGLFAITQTAGGTNQVVAPGGLPIRATPYAFTITATP